MHKAILPGSRGEGGFFLLKWRGLLEKGVVCVKLGGLGVESYEV